MGTAGIRELKQNASSVVARAVGGETVTITDRGRPVAQLIPLPTSRLDQLVATGLATSATRDVRDLPAPEPHPDGPTVLSDALMAERAEDWR